MTKQKRVGIVISNKTDKTIVVATQVRYCHQKYKKTLLKTRKFMAHDPENAAVKGDLVLLEESSPYSKRKNWLLKDILDSILN